MVAHGRIVLVAPLVTGISPLERAQSRAQKAARDVFLVIAALALLTSQALSTLHYVLVPHHLCAVHGVLEDGGASVGTPSPDHDGSHDAVKADESEQDVHDACSVATRAEHGALLERASLQSVRLPGAFVTTTGAGVLLAPDRAALLSSAPKTSPPTRA